MASKPTVVLVPGAHHRPIHYKRLGDAIEARGYPVHYITNPSTGATPTDTNFEDDVANLQQQLKLLEDDGKDVIIVPHSYGGMIVSTALKDYRKGRILALVYMAAIASPEGVSMLELFKMRPVEGEGGHLPTIIDGAIQAPDPMVFYDDLPEAEREAWGKELLTQPYSVATASSQGAPWSWVPTIYIFTEKDIILPPGIQQRMTDDVMGKDVEVVKLDSSHSPFLSMPDKVVDVIQRAEELGRSKTG